MKPQSITPSEQTSRHGWNLEHSYARLPALLFEPWQVTPARAPRAVVINRALATELGLDAEHLASPEGTAILAGNTLPPNAFPIAQAYAGHQFGNFTGLGDGRALLLGEQIAPDGRRFDVQWKGSGPTPFSRGGDGRAALGPMLREFVISEAMHRLGIPTTRVLAVTATGETVLRHDGPLPGAVLTRIASSHIRIGTFQWAAAHEDTACLAALLEHTLTRHFPDHRNAANPAIALLDAVISSQASLVARWMNTGFVHGVLNTDNTALSGETIDYGPCAFLDAYDPSTVFSSIDRHGRYAFGNQPDIIGWNLTRLAGTLVPLIDKDPEHAVDLAKDALARFPERFQSAFHTGLLAKIGITTPHEGDTALASRLLAWMRESKADFTNTFLALSQPEALQSPPFAEPSFREWHARWLDRIRTAQDPQTSLATMRANNPTVIPRNHKVEEALAAATNDGNLQPLETLLQQLASPYDHSNPAAAEFREPAPPGSPPYRTFCGT
jgi:uncharacterized protein YdiU (UPF0061 family)